jgi:hypothetical protein
MELKLILTLQRDSKGKLSSAFLVTKIQAPWFFGGESYHEAARSREKNNGAMVRSMSRAKLELILCRLHVHADLYGELHVEMGKVEITCLARVNGT